MMLTIMNSFLFMTKKKSFVLWSINKDLFVLEILIFVL